MTVHRLRPPQPPSRTPAPTRPQGYCVFCGEPLAGRGRGGRVRCRRCRAVLLQERDRDGCLVGLRVQSCGTPDCCQGVR
ncbi:MAG: hypothetical protein HYY91_04935 [Candidatus Omnitrophica bacterium]|nr:hypothetical protein [Candidatus Omnitrophota bacterium]